MSVLPRLLCTVLLLLAAALSALAGGSKSDYERAANLVALGVLLLTPARYLMNDSLAHTFAELLVVLALNRLLNRRSSRDYLHLYVISFGLLLAATVLNTELLFAPCFNIRVFMISHINFLHFHNEKTPVASPSGVQALSNFSRFPNDALSCPRSEGAGSGSCRGQSRDIHGAGLYHKRARHL